MVKYFNEKIYNVCPLYYSNDELLLSSVTSEKSARHFISKGKKLGNSQWAFFQKNISLNCQVNNEAHRCQF